MKFNLQDVLNNQEKFQSQFGFEKGKHSIEELVNLIHTHGSFAVEEIFEMLRELPYHKYWVDYSALTQDDMEAKINNAKKEFIDVFIFMMNVALFLGMDADEIFELYTQKQKINVERQENPELGYINKK